MTLEYKDWETYQLKCWRNHNHVYMRRMLIWIYYTFFLFFFLCLGFVPLGFTGKVFNEAVTIFLWSSKGECYKIWSFIGLWELVEDHPYWCYLFVNPYKREIPLMKIHFILFLHSNFFFFVFFSFHFIILQQKYYFYVLFFN